MTTSMLHDAFAHRIWATERLIDVCAELTDEQLRMAVPGTFGSIIDTFRHLVSSDGWYLAFFRDWTNLVEEDAEASFAELRSAITTNGAAWMELLAGDLEADTDVPEQGDGWIFHAPVGFRLAQVVHHGTDHRSQICTALTGLGIEPPGIDVWDYGQAKGRTQEEYLAAGSPDVTST